MSKPSLSLPVFLTIMLLAVASAEPFSQEDLPLAVRKTLEGEIGKGSVVDQERFRWGDITIYRFQVQLEGKPAMELEIAENGKVIREDSPESEE